MFDFPSYLTWLNVLLFAASAGVIWYAGTKMERQADEIARRTGLGQAFIGMLLLAGATSLPEITTTVTAVQIGYCAFAIATLVVLGSAWLLTRTGDALAVQTGLCGGFVGFALIALATTLPEISTTVSAARSGSENMAIANIFGSSAFVVMVLGVTAAFLGGDVLLLASSPSGTFAATLGMVVTLTYLWGLLEHADRTALRMGWDSLAVVVLVLGGSCVIYVLE